MTFPKLLHAALAAAMIALPAPALALAPDEDDFYEPFDPNAPELEIPLPDVSAAEILDPRIMSIDTVPGAFQPAYGLAIYIFQIGQADSMLVVGPGPARKTMLVDLGVARHGRFKTDYSARHVATRIAQITGRRHIDYFVLSHLHSDHFGSGNSGITTLMAHSKFTFGTVIDTGLMGLKTVDRDKGATEYLGRMPSLIASGKIGRHIEPEFGSGQIDLGGNVKVDIVTFAGKTGPLHQGVHADYEKQHPGYFDRKKHSENDLSIGMEISLGDFEFWTGGDLSGADRDGRAPRTRNYVNVEYPLVQAWRAAGRESDVEIYRANHHGSRYSSGRDFLAALDPEIILMSADVGHRHPSKPMVQRGAGTAEMFATDIDPSWKKKDFAALKGRVVGEIRVLVGQDGSGYALNGTPYRSYTDREEAEGKDSRPAP